MPGYLLHVGATVICAHGGQAQPTSPNPRVKVMGQPVVTQPFPYTIAGCANTTPAGPLPCVMAQWVMAATRVKVMGQPVLLQDSQAVCTPTGAPLTIVASQVRVKGM
jgi:hypothetical protein